VAAQSSVSLVGRARHRLRTHVTEHPALYLPLATVKRALRVDVRDLQRPGEAVVAVTHAVMIRLTLVALNGVEGESWRRPIGRGSVTEFRVDGTIRLAALPEEVGSTLPFVAEARVPAGSPASV
jgi:broad specificity phosphatase PhoE